MSGTSHMQCCCLPCPCEGGYWECTITGNGCLSDTVDYCNDIHSNEYTGGMIYYYLGNYMCYPTAGPGGAPQSQWTASYTRKSKVAPHYNYTLYLYLTITLDRTNSTANYFFLAKHGTYPTTIYHTWAKSIDWDDLECDEMYDFWWDAKGGPCDHCVTYGGTKPSDFQLYLQWHED